MRIASIVFWLLLGSSAMLVADESRNPKSPSPNDPAVKERLQFWKTWNHQNWLVRQVRTGQEDLQTVLLVDPAESRIAKINGNGEFVGSLDLPEHRNWRAFHVTPQGIAELTFPVRIQWVDSDHAIPEQIEIQSLDRVELGPGNVGGFAMTFGHGHAGIGYRTMGTKETFCWRLKESDPKPDQQSMLIGVDRSSLEYRKSIEVGQTNTSVIAGE